MSLSLQVENAIGNFAHRSGFTERGGVVIDLDGTAVHEENGRTMIPRPVELGLKALYDRGRVKAFNLLNYTEEIERAIATKDKLALTRFRTRFAGVFDLYSLGR